MACSLLIGAAAAAVSVPMDTTNEIRFEFNDFVERFNKIYATEEERERRRAIFESNMEDLRESLHESKEGLFGETATYGPTKFMDWQDDELDGLLIPNDILFDPIVNGSCTLDVRKNFVNTEDSKVHDSIRQRRLAATSPPESLDWRDMVNGNGVKIVTPIKDQGLCGSCWAFAGIEVMESSWLLANYSTIGSDGSLSVQHILSCNPGHWGCRGGTANVVFSYALEYLVPSQASEPYKCSKLCPALSCPGNVPRPDSTSNTSGGAFVQQYCSHSFFCNGQVFEDNIKQLLAANGPVAITVDARAWYKYQSGIIRDHCSSDAPNHAVVLVGYGTEVYPQGNISYWIVRNSWGPDWGEDGFVRLYRDGQSNTCGFANSIVAATPEPITSNLVGFPSPFPSPCH